MSSQYAVAPEPALQVKVATLPLRVDPGVGVCMTPRLLDALNAVYVYWLFSHWPFTREYSVTYTVLPFVGRPLTVTVSTLPRLPDWKYWLPPGVFPTSSQ